MKDSFADLDLARLGFDELFEAQWIFREPASAPRKSRLIWTVLSTEDELAEWTSAAGLSHTIRSDLMREASVRLLAARGPDGLTAGAIANRTASVVGVSNVFTTTAPADAVWSSLGTRLARRFRRCRWSATSAARTYKRHWQEPSPRSAVFECGYAPRCVAGSRNHDTVVCFSSAACR